MDQDKDLSFVCLGGADIIIMVVGNNASLNIKRAKNFTIFFIY